MQERSIGIRGDRLPVSRGRLLRIASLFLAVGLAVASPAFGSKGSGLFVSAHQISGFPAKEVLPLRSVSDTVQHEPGILPGVDIPFTDRFLVVWRFELFSIDDRPVRVNQFVMALLAFFVGLAVLGQVVRVFRKRVLPKTTLKPNEAATAAKLLYYFGVVLILMLSMRIIRIPLTAFAFVGGALAIGVGFGAQNLINNFISGFILMAERPIRVGDVIDIEGTFATVEDIGPRSTRIRTGDNIHVLVPNSSFLEKNIVNWTLSDKMVRAHITVGVAYGSPVRKVEELLLRSVGEDDKVLKHPKPLVLFKDFGDNALLFHLYFWVSMESLVERLIIESNVRFRIDDLFRESGIVIAFPQRDVHLDSLKPLELKILRGEGKTERGQ